MPPLSSLQSRSFLNTPSNASQSRRHVCRDEDNDSEESFESELSLTEMRMHQSAIDSCYGCDLIDESTSSDDDKFVCESEPQLGRSDQNDSVETLHPECERRNGSAVDNESISGSCKGEGWKKGWSVTELNHSRRVSRAFLPYWVYRMYDSYCLAQRAAGNLTLLFCFILSLQCFTVQEFVHLWN